MSEVRSKAKGVGNKRRMFIGSLVMLLVFGIAMRWTLGDDRPTNPDFEPRTVEIIPYQDSEYRFLIIPKNETPPSGFEQPDFEDTNFKPGSAAFGAGGGGAIGGGDCPLQSTVQTEWPLESQLLVRRVVSIPDGAFKVRIMVSVDNDIIGVFFNGELVPPPPGLSYPIEHRECPVLDEFRFDVPIKRVHPGENLVAFHVLDRPPTLGPANESFFDARVLANISRVDLTNDVMEIIEDFPIEPVSLIDVSCTLGPLPPQEEPFFTPSTLTIKFAVDANQDLGEITIEDLLPDQTIITKEINDLKITKCTTFRSQTTCIKFDSNIRKTSIKSILALESVFAHPDTIRQTFECFLSLPQTGSQQIGTQLQQQGIGAREIACSVAATLTDTGCTVGEILAIPSGVGLVLEAIERLTERDFCTDGADAAFDMCITDEEPSPTP